MLVAYLQGALDEVTDVIVAHAHLAVLAVLGVAIGLTRDKRNRALGRVIVLFIASSLFYQAWAAEMPDASADDMEFMWDVAYEQAQAIAAR